MKNFILLICSTVFGILSLQAQTLNVDLGPNLIVCQDSCVTLGPSASLVADGYLWSTGDTTRTLNFCANSFGDSTLTLTAFDSAGNTGISSIILTTVACGDSVWPGDANNDGIANVYDISRVGQGFGFSGLARPNASTNWVGQAAYNWAGSAVLDYKYADCDGNGVIEYADFQVVQLNYGLTHLKGQEPMPRSTGDPILRIYCDQDSLLAGDTITFHIEIADSLNPVLDFYSIAFDVLIDSALLVPNVSFSNYNQNFIGSPGSVIYGFDTTLWQASMLQLGFTKLNQTNVTGYGNIADVSYILIDDIAGKTSTNEINAICQVYFTNVMAISADGTVIPLDVQGDTVVVRQLVSGIGEPIAADDIKLYPVPASNLLSVQLPSNVTMNHIEVYSSIGKMVSSTPVGNLSTVSFDVSSYPNGYYFIKIQTDNGWVTKRFSIIK